MLLKKGAGIGNIVIILSAWAVIKVPMLANEVKFLGPAFMATRWVLTVLSIFLMGWLMNKFIPGSKLPSTDTETDRIAINPAYCIGCGLCAGNLPDYFKMENGKAIVLGSRATETETGQLVHIAAKCPASAITINQ